ncbi:unnamed protein product [Gordionus sp. m RMFG-2023]
MEHYELLSIPSKTLERIIDGYGINSRMIHTKWFDFLNHCSKEYTSEYKKMKLYFIIADLNKCYDNIDTQKLYSILTELIIQLSPPFYYCSYYEIKKQNSKKFSNDGYVIHNTREAKINKNLKFLFSRTKQDALEDISDSNSKFFTNNCSNEIKYNLIYIRKQSEIKTLQLNTILQAVSLHVFHKYIKENFSSPRKIYRIYKLSKGIPQGSSLSSLFCDMYLGHMEKLLFKSIFNSKQCFIVRNVDDYLFITPLYIEANRFLELLHSGVAECSLKINTNKLNHNLYLNADQISWCGYDFNTKYPFRVNLNLIKYYNMKVEDTIIFNSDNGLDWIVEIGAANNYWDIIETKIKYDKVRKLPRTSSMDRENRKNDINENQIPGIVKGRESA